MANYTHESLKVSEYLTHSEYEQFTALLNSYVDEQRYTAEEIDQMMLNHCRVNWPDSYKRYQLAITDAKGRVELELAELNDKLKKAKNFTFGKVFLTLSADARLLLEEQIDHMQHYADCLKDRLEIWDK